MSVILFGDTHALIDIKKMTDYFDENPDYTKSDYAVILGDAGIIWNDEQDKTVLKILRGLPVTVLWIDGNHENFDKLYSYPVQQWHGGKVHFIADDVIHLMRGQLFEIDGKGFFTFGGASSADRYLRTEGKSWWQQEMPSNEEYETGLDTLEKADWRVDYILTHTCPKHISRYFTRYPDNREIPLLSYFDKIAESTEFTGWYFGHWHEDVKIGRFYGLYDIPIKLF